MPHLGDKTSWSVTGPPGVEAAETGESDAQALNRKEGARDGTVGVAQYVTNHPTGLAG